MPIAPIPSHLVLSPKDRLKPLSSLAVIHNAQWWSLATGTWDTKRCLLMRWRGTVDMPLGNPVSHGNPTWFVVPDDPALQSALLGIAGQFEADSARSWLAGGPGEASLPDGGLK